jgi:hypothetical protein
LFDFENLVISFIEQLRGDSANETALLHVVMRMIDPDRSQDEELAIKDANLLLDRFEGTFFCNIIFNYSS